jgi:hypothetical protein
MRIRARLASRVLIVAVLLGTVLLTGLTGVTGSPAATAAENRVSPRAFRGLGTWVDVYDFGSAFQGSSSSPPAITAGSVDDMAKLGVKTLYLQASQDDTRSDGFIADRRLVGNILRRAHRRGVQVIAWYLPHFADVDRDMRHVRAMYEFRSKGERFDGIALDLEWTSDVEDTEKRNRALIELSERTRDLVRNMPIGAIVLEPVLLEDVNTAYWPDFPWKKLAPFFDVWLPMSYWTNRSESSGWNDGFRYTSENIRRVRTNLGDRNAVVHAIGGIADSANAGDYEGFVSAAKERRAIGWSIYDYVTTSSSAWPRLRP